PPAGAAEPEPEPEPEPFVVVAPVVVASPIPLTELPLAVTGALAPMGASRPPSTPLSPEVLPPAGAAWPAPLTVVAGCVVVESPITLTALPDAVTGAFA